MASPNIKADPTIVNMAYKEAMSKVPFSTEGMFDSYLETRGDMLDALSGTIGAALETTATLVSKKNEAHEAFTDALEDPALGEQDRAELKEIQKQKRKEYRKAKTKEEKDEVLRSIEGILTGRQKDNVSLGVSVKRLDPNSNLIDYENTSDGAIWMTTQAMNLAAGKEVEGDFKRDGSSGRALYSGTYTYPEGHPRAGEKEVFENESITSLSQKIEPKDFKAVGEVEKQHQSIETQSRKNKFYQWDQNTIDKTINDYKRIIEKNAAGFMSIAGERINGQPSLKEALRDPRSDMGKLVLKQLYELNPKLDITGDGALDEADFDGKTDYVTANNYEKMVESYTMNRVNGKTNPNFNLKNSTDLLARYLTMTAGNNAYNSGQQLGGHGQEKLTTAQKNLQTQDERADTRLQNTLQILNEGRATKMPHPSDEKRTIVKLNDGTFANVLRKDSGYTDEAIRKVYKTMSYEELVTNLNPLNKDWSQPKN